MIDPPQQKKILKRLWAVSVTLWLVVGWVLDHCEPGPPWNPLWEVLRSLPRDRSRPPAPGPGFPPYSP